MNVPNTYKELEPLQSDLHATILRPDCQAQLLTLVFSEGSAGELSTLSIKACSHCRKANVKTSEKQYPYQVDFEQFQRAVKFKLCKR